MAVADEIETRLREAFAPRDLAVEDQSERHRGHAGWREGGETHFHVVIAGDAFADMGRVQRHRAIHAALGPGLIERIHALSLDVGP
jgi:BolA protein